MIVSIVFRRDIENKYLRNWIEAQCFEFQKYTQDITRVQVMLSRISHHKKSSTSFQCHISIHATGRKYIDIYEKHCNAGVAFNRAFDRVCAELSQEYSAKKFDRRNAIKFLAATESYLYGSQLEM